MSSDNNGSVYEPSKKADQKTSPTSSKRQGFTDDMQPVYAVEIVRKATADMTKKFDEVSKTEKLDYTRDNMHHGSVTVEGPSGFGNEENANIFKTTAWYDWRGLEFSVPDEVIITLEFIKQGLDLIVTVLDAIASLLEILKLLLGAVQDLLLAVIDPIIAKIEEIIDLFRGKTGLHFLVVPPVMKEVTVADAREYYEDVIASHEIAAHLIQDKAATDTTFKTAWEAKGYQSEVAWLKQTEYFQENKKSATRRTRGGNMGFYDLVVETLNDDKDWSRPQYGENAWVGGLVMMVGAPGLAQFRRLWSDLKKLFQIQDEPRSFGDPPPVTGFTASVDAQMLVHNDQRLDWLTENTWAGGPGWYGAMEPIVNLSWDKMSSEDDFPSWEPYKECIIRMVDPESVEWKRESDTNDAGMGYYKGDKDKYLEHFSYFSSGSESEIDPYGSYDIKNSEDFSRESLKPSWAEEPNGNYGPWLNYHIIAERDLDSLWIDKVPFVSAIPKEFFEGLGNEYGDYPDSVLGNISSGVYNIALDGWNTYSKSEFKEDMKPGGESASISTFSRAEDKPLTYHYRLVRFYRRKLGEQPGPKGRLGMRTKKTVYEPHPDRTGKGARFRYNVPNPKKTGPDSVLTGVPYDPQHQLCFPQYQFDFEGVNKKEDAAYAVVFSGVSTIVIPPGNVPRPTGPEPNWKGVAFGALLPNALVQIILFILKLIKKIRALLKGLLGWLVSMIDALLRMVNKWKAFIAQIAAIIGRLQRLLMLPIGGYVLTFFGKGGNDFFTGMLKETLELGIADRKAREEEKLRLMREAVKNTMARKLGDKLPKLEMGKEWNDRIGASLTSQYNEAVSGLTKVYDGMGTKDPGAWDVAEQLRRVDEGKDPDSNAIPEKYRTDYDKALDEKLGMPEGKTLGGVKDITAGRVGQIVPSYGDDDVAAGIILMAGDGTAQAISDLIAMFKLLFGGGSGDSGKTSEESLLMDAAVRAGDAVGPDPADVVQQPKVFKANMQAVDAAGDSASEDSDNYDDSGGSGEGGGASGAGDGDSGYSTPEEQSANSASGQKGFDAKMNEVDPKDGSDNKCPVDIDVEY